MFLLVLIPCDLLPLFSCLLCKNILNRNPKLDGSAKGQYASDARNYHINVFVWLEKKFYIEKYDDDTNYTGLH